MCSTALSFSFFICKMGILVPSSPSMCGSKMIVNIEDVAQCLTQAGIHRQKFSSMVLYFLSSFQTIAPMHHTQNYLSTRIDSNVCERQSEVSEFQACEGQMTAQKCLRFAMLTKQSESATSRGRLVTRGRAVPCSARRTTGSVWTGGDGFPCTGCGNPPTARVEMAPKRG